MKRVPGFIFGTFLLLLFLSYLFTYRVNYNETALITTFGKATKEGLKNSDGFGAGLYFKLPWPIQRIIRFDRRLSVLEDQLEQQETKDKQVIIIKVFAVWKISNALQFYRYFNTREKAEIFIRERLRTAKAEIGRFTFTELTNADPNKLKLDNAQKALFDRINQDLSHQQYGVDLSEVGISRIILPEDITRSVFSRMKQTRQRMAQNARSEGKAAAQSIIAKTDSDSKRILAFAERMSQNIIARGDSAAAQYYKEYAKNNNFAIFLRKLEAFKKSLSTNTTFILDTDNEPFDLLK
ncbi:MAG: protease modulator HflC [Chitinispirillia bacterium]|jgi:membrane protease subunit HflC